MSIDSTEMVSPYNLIPDKKYTVKSVGDKSIIKGIFSKYENNKIKDEDVLSIVLIDWCCEGDPHPHRNPCKIPLYLDPNNNLEFYEILDINV